CIWCKWLITVLDKFFNFLKSKDYIHLHAPLIPIFAVKNWEICRIRAS
ncbi:hypothetical protein A2U01_0106765, partial [Trifolium medium]|nr:hypothetical protein [Trifolium medium]